jgi:hypothetical protein
MEMNSFMSKTLVCLTCWLLQRSQEDPNIRSSVQPYRWLTSGIHMASSMDGTRQERGQQHEVVDTLNKQLHSEKAFRQDVIAKIKRRNQISKELETNLL